METNIQYNEDRELLSMVSEDQVFEFRMTRNPRDYFMFSMETDISPDTFLARTDHKEPQIESSEIPDKLLDKVESFINGDYDIIERVLTEQEEEIDEIYFKDGAGSSETFYGWQNGELYVLSDSYSPEDVQHFFESAGADALSYMEACDEALDMYEDHFS